jgi:glutamate N-acetyltransferase/amino-acid N-acetyltransferase
MTSPSTSGSGVTAPGGFSAAGVVAHIRSDGRADLALVRNEGPDFHAAGVFTSNRVFAAPVGWSRAAVADGRLVAVILNSGGANACTGEPGRADSAATAAAVAAEVGCEATDVAVCSTGLIGVRLPMPKLLDAIPTAVRELSVDGGNRAARAIMTTDTVPKEASVSDPSGYTVGGMAKGAGMLAPGLATMLVVLTTDAVVSPTDLDRSLRAATRVTFDRADSDGCMSTNDTVLLLANGASGVKPEVGEFTVALTEVCRRLAVGLIADAEGADHEIAVEVVAAASEDDAVEVARAVARSNLFKCAIAGNDPNWGRVLAAVGTTRAAFDPERLDVSFNGVPVYVQGGLGADRSEVDLGPRRVQVRIALNAGDQSATVWTNDLTHAYVSENADYPS